MLARDLGCLDFQGITKNGEAEKSKVRGVIDNEGGGMEWLCQASPRTRNHASSQKLSKDTGQVTTLVCCSLVGMSPHQIKGN